MFNLTNRNVRELYVIIINDEDLLNIAIESSDSELCDIISETFITTKEQDDYFNENFDRSEFI